MVRCRKHWIMFVKPAIIVAVIAYFLRSAIIIRSAKAQSILKGTVLETALSTRTMNIVIPILVFAILLVVGYALLIYTTDRIELTGTGNVVYSSTSGHGSIPSEYVQSVDVHRSLLGMLLGYATITLVLFGANAENVTIKQLKNGKNLAEAVNGGYHEKY